MRKSESGCARREMAGHGDTLDRLETQQFRLQHQRAAQTDALLLAAREQSGSSR